MNHNQENRKAYPEPSALLTKRTEEHWVGFRNRLIEWFEREGRDLPWRETKDPYKIWLSEVILQQTQVKQGWDYYLRFIEHYPTVLDLATAPEDEILLLWQGLGYYSRALNLHTAAKQIVQRHGGHFPQNRKEIAALKGIGPYTTAAIMSIAYDEPLAVLDGNVFRILSRLEGSEIPIDTTVGRKYYQTLADLYLDQQRPSKYNQALMDLGAMICRPRQPLCTQCPVANFCQAAGNNELTSRLPLKAKSIPITTIYMDYLLWIQEGGIYIEERNKDGIWKGLYQLPLRESQERYMTPEELQEWVNRLSNEGDASLLESIDLPPHRLTHRLLKIRVHIISATTSLPSPYLLIPDSSHAEYAFPKPLRAFLDRHFNK